MLDRRARRREGLCTKTSPVKALVVARQHNAMGSQTIYLQDSVQEAGVAEVSQAGHSELVIGHSRQAIASRPENETE